MAIEVQGPDGAVIEFPDGTSGDIIKGVMAKRYQKSSLNPMPDQGPGRFASPAELKPPEQKSWTDTAVDVAKSAGVGLGQGILAAGTMPGNIEQLARMGIDKGAEMLGYQNPQTQKSGQWFPHYGDVKGAFEEVLTGKFYEPKTVPGEYARTIGEFAPAALGGGGPAGIASRVLIPGVATETAGQMTKGTAAEPWARAGAAIASTVLPRAIGRAVSPSRIDPERARQVAILDREGIQPTAGQRTGSEALQYRESNAVSTAMAGRSPQRLQDRPLEQFTQAMMRRAGSNAPRATADAIDDTFTALGSKFDGLARQASVSPLDPTLRQRITQAVADYESKMPDAMKSPYPRKIANDLLSSQGMIPGDKVAAIRTQLSQDSWGTRHTQHDYSRALRSIYEALDDAVERGLPQAARGQYTQVRDQYRNLLAIEKAATAAGANPASGLLTPQQMRAALVGQDRRSYARGQREMDEVTRAGNAILKQMPNSGTPARLQAMGINAALWGVGGALATGNPMGAAAAIGGPVGQAAYARAITSGPVQRYLGRQTHRPPMVTQGAAAETQAAPYLDENDERTIRLRRALGGQ